jgi:electron transport complex protein RnfE
MKNFKVFLNGIINENPIFVQLIGMCAVLAVSTNAINSLARCVSNSSTSRL